MDYRRYERYENEDDMRAPFIVALVVTLGVYAMFLSACVALVYELYRWAIG